MPQLPTRPMYTGHQDANTINQRKFSCLFPDYHRGFMSWRMYIDLYPTSPPSPQISLAGAGIVHGYNFPTGREELMHLVKPKCAYKLHRFSACALGIRCGWYYPSTSSIPLGLSFPNW